MYQTTHFGSFFTGAFSFPGEKLGPKNRFVPKNTCLFFPSQEIVTTSKKQGSLHPCFFSLHEKNRNAKKQDGVFKHVLVTIEIYLLHHDAQDLHAPKYGSDTTHPQIVGS